MNIQCHNVIVERRPEIVIVNKVEKTAIVIKQKNNWQGKGKDWKVSESQKRDPETLES